LVPLALLKPKSGLKYPIPAALVKGSMGVLILPGRGDILAGDVGFDVMGP
jgi:hypothetical protein